MMIWAKVIGLTIWGAAALAQDLPAPLTDADFEPVRLEEALLGQKLFYDPILSGNREVSCATCHHPAFGTSDGLSLGIGDGGIGLGTARVADPENMPEQRIPRNAPGLFNLGAQEFTVMFHDGRVESIGKTVGFNGSDGLVKGHRLFKPGKSIAAHAHQCNQKKD